MLISARPTRVADAYLKGSSAGPAIVGSRESTGPSIRPFVLRCPECMAPLEPPSVVRGDDRGPHCSAPTLAGATICKYCQVPLRWEPAESLSRDDWNWRRRLEEEDAAADPDVIPIGFGPMVIHMLTRTTFQAQAQLPCRPTHLYVPPHLSNYFSIVDLRVGVDSYFATPNPLPASWFSTGRGSPVACDVAMPGVLITLVVENKSYENKTFEALLRCKKLGQWPPLAGR